MISRLTSWLRSSPKSPPSPPGPSGPCIRPLRLSDCDAVAALDALTWPGPRKWRLTAGEVEEAFESGEYALAVVDDPPHGPVAFCAWSVSRDKRHVILYRVAVAPGHQGRGYGTALWLPLAANLRNGLPAKVYAHVPDRGLAAQMWLKRRGFRCRKIAGDFFAPGRDAYLFEYAAPRPLPGEDA